MSLKTHFSKALRAACFTRRGFVVSKRDFAGVIEEPFEKAFSMISRMASRNPFDCNAIDKKKMIPSAHQGVRQCEMCRQMKVKLLQMHHLLFQSLLMRHILLLNWMSHQSIQGIHLNLVTRNVQMCLQII